MEVSVASRWLAGCSGRVASTGNEFGLITSGRRRLERSEAGLLVQFVVCTTQSKSRAHVLLRPMSHLRFYRAIVSHESATSSRDSIADGATVELHAATSSHKQTRLLHRFSRFTIHLHKHSSKMMKRFHMLVLDKVDCCLQLFLLCILIS